MKSKAVLILTIIFLVFSGLTYSQTTPAGKEVKEVVVIPLKYQNPQKMLQMLKDLMGEIKASMDEVRKSILIFDTEEKVNQAKKIIAAQDTPYKQVMIAVQVAEVSNTDTKGIGWELKDYSVSLKTLLPPTGKTLTVNSLGDIFPGLVNIAGENARIKVLATPKIMVIDEQKAQLGSGDKVPIPISQSQVVQGQVATSTSVQFEDVGVKLTVTPHIYSETDEIVLDVAGEVSSIGKYTAQGYPQISTRNFQTSIKLKNGWTAVLGGLIREEQRETYSGVPFFMDIPVLGALFRKNKIENVQSEVKISLTPLIVKEEMIKAETEAVKKEQEKKSIKEARTSLGALWRSSAVPGWGQVYSGYEIKGCAITSFEILSVSGAIAYEVNRWNAKKAGNLTKENDYRKIRNAMIYTSAGLWLLNIADAYFFAEEEIVETADTGSRIRPEVKSGCISDTPLLIGMNVKF